jgi:AcrR family transcriptional regulator
MDRPPAARPGRKRSEEARAAILAAAFELVGELGYPGLTIEGIAARSGVGKQTIYRWWPSKADVLLDALATKADLFIPIPDEGGYAADLRAFLSASFAMGRDRRVVDVLRSIMAHAQIDEAFGARFRTAFLQGRRDALGTIIERARERGDLPAATSPDVVMDLVFGLIWYRVLTRRDLVEDGLADEIVAALAERRG